LIAPNAGDTPATPEVVVKIISGGQTGIDRAALEVGLKYGIECGGWCPDHRADEFGRIPERYPLQEVERRGFNERTRRNVRDSDATVIIYIDRLQGGTDHTLSRCIKQRKPHLLIDAAKLSPQEAANAIIDFTRTHTIEILNVAGPRQSEWPGGYDYTFRALDIFLTLCSHRPVGG
jgi:Circularly permutated YpsA SLOG family